MTGDQLDAAMRYFGALFSRFKQAGSPEVLVAYGQRIKSFSAVDVKQAIEELAEGSLIFPSVQELVEACRLVQERNKPAYQPPRIAAPKELPLTLFVRSMRESGEVRPVRGNEIRAFRMLRQANLPVGGNMAGLFKALTAGKTNIPLTDEVYATVDEFLAHEGYATR